MFYFATERHDLQGKSKIDLVNDLIQPSLCLPAEPTSYGFLVSIGFSASNEFRAWISLH
ncbi:hypothetical protein [Paenibacillus sp. VT-400]|uniref:hypothetical protein n=1 Tax=Paenibacillus sp. VT-400 TaxID=1495853 RepID=UPI000A8FCB9E|nr:hypothetical protein [Paenibacillus sp. VT-400]